MDFTEYRRVTLFAGHYGSGKTNIAVNYALMLKRRENRVVLADLDIVNPYFRAKDSRAMLEENGIRFISSKYAGSNLDAPAMPGAAYSVTDDLEQHAVIDVGGDDRGALALGRYAPALGREGNYDFFFVLNLCRPLTRDAESAAAVMREIAGAAGLSFTGIFNNTNIGAETTAETVLSSINEAEKLSKLTGVPIRALTVKEDLFAALSGKAEKLVPIRLYVKQSFIQ